MAGQFSRRKRENVVTKIEAAIYSANIITKRNGMEMEEHIFEKAKCQEEYCMFIALLIQKIRECGVGLDSDLAGPSYADIMQPVVDPLSEVLILIKRGPSTREVQERRRLEELDLSMPSTRSGSMLTPGGRSAQSEKFKGDYSWKTPAFRKSVIAKFDETMFRYGRPTSKNSMEMEQLLFDKAKSRKEYTDFVGRVLLHIREMGSRRDEEFELPPVNDISDLIPDPLGVFLGKERRRRYHFPPYCCSGLGGTPKRLLGGG